MELASEAASRPAVMVGVAHVGLAEVLRERGELDAARHHAGEAVRLGRQLAHGQWLGTALAVLAWIREAQGDRAGALEAIGEAEQAVPNRPALADLVFPVAVQRARLLLAHGQVARAARWVTERGLDAEDEPSYAREREYLVLARVLLAEHAPELALGLLRRLHDLAVAQQRMGNLIEIRALQALALAAVDDRPGALDALAGALTLAAPVVTPGLVDPLTDRELEVLGLLATGTSNRDIADDLVVTVETVKKHVSHILDKLGAANRTQAVARARQLRLLELV
jgi:LuxR family transcriptional regulator, maltose regulon positive regulatory protein